MHSYRSQHSSRTPSSRKRASCSRSELASRPLLLQIESLTLCSPLQILQDARRQPVTSMVWRIARPQGGRTRRDRQAVDLRRDLPVSAIVERTFVVEWLAEALVYTLQVTERRATKDVCQARRRRQGVRRRGAHLLEHARVWTTCVACCFSHFSSPVPTLISSRAPSQSSTN